MSHQKQFETFNKDGLEYISMSYPGTNGTVNPLYTGGLFHCYMLDENICNFRGVRLSFFRNLYKKNGCMFCKQWRPWSDAAFCGIWSGSALFAKVPILGYPVYKGLNFKWEYFAVHLRQFIGNRYWILQPLEFHILKQSKHHKLLIKMKQ